MVIYFKESKVKISIYPVIFIKTLIYKNLLKIGKFGPNYLKKSEMYLFFKGSKRMKYASNSRWRNEDRTECNVSPGRNNGRHTRRKPFFINKCTIRATQIRHQKITAFLLQSGMCTGYYITTLGIKKGTSFSKKKKGPTNTGFHNLKWLKSWFHSHREM